MKALLVDDFVPMLRFEELILEKLGFETSCAYNGIDALRQLDELRLPDVVLLDWDMPEMDGLEFINTVRSQPRFDGMVIIMVTTEIESDDISRALEAGANEYLMKPFDEACLFEKLRLAKVVA